MSYQRILPMVLMLTGCGVFSPVKDSAVYHLLDPLAPNRRLTNRNPTVAVNRPSIPGYLDRQQLVTRNGGTLVISELDLWGEPLDTGIARVTSSNLSRLTGSATIQPVEDFVTLDYAVLLELRIQGFEPDASGQMILEGTWNLQPTRGGEANRHYFRIPMTIASSPSTPVARVDAMNKCLYLLARQIADDF